MMDLARRSLPFVVVLGTMALIPVAARAQIGTGGATGTTLGESDIYASVQETMGVPLTDRARELFLNRANCQCSVPVWLKAVVLPAAAPRAAAVSPSATVSMYIGNGCDATATLPCCHRLASTTFSQFRLTGLTAESTVDDLARIWSTTSGNCGDVRGGATTGSGGATGTGGTTDTGGTSGAGGTGSGGASGTGGATAAPVAGVCNGTLFGQTLWVFVGTSGDGSHEVVTTKLGFNVDPEPPQAPTDVTLGSVHEALVVNWTGLSTASASDLLGYQILCTRGDTTQVFKDGTFAASFDSCPGATTGEWPVSAQARTSFVCSELLSPASTSYRLKILENDITYLVGVAAIDKKGNASPIAPTPGIPAATRDFYYDYRHGDPQGGATGGYCGISGTAAGSRGESIAAMLVGLAMLALALGRRRPHRGPRR